MNVFICSFIVYLFQDAYRVCMVESDTQITRLEDAVQTILLGDARVSTGTIANQIFPCLELRKYK